MFGKSTRSNSTTFRYGWTIIFLISLLGVVSQLVLIFVAPGLVDSTIAWATFMLYSVFVVLIPYRRGERWAWMITWVLVFPLTVLGLNNPDAAPYFWSAAGLVAVSQLLTRSAFFRAS
jgi:hypothetical protein